MRIQPWSASFLIMESTAWKLATETFSRQKIRQGAVINDVMQEGEGGSKTPCYDKLNAAVLNRLSSVYPLELLAYPLYYDYFNWCTVYAVVPIGLFWFYFVSFSFSSFNALEHTSLYKNEPNDREILQWRLHMP